MRKINHVGLNFLTYRIQAGLSSCCRGDEYNTDEKKGNALWTLHSVYSLIN